MTTNLITPNSNKKVLVVEDERIIAINICSTLKQYGYISNYVSEGQAALESVDTETYDLVLMDIMLNGDLDGIEVAKIIKQRKDLPIIYLTAYSDESTLDRAKTTEPFGYLIKPFNSRDLYISVEMAIYKSHIQKQLRDVQNKLSETQKWETIGLVATGISHEVNNPLTSILNLAELIGLEAGKAGLPQITSYSKKIMEESERIAKIIKNLVSYSQTTTNQWSYSNIMIVIADTRSFLHHYFLKEGIQCEIQSDDLPLVPCQSQKIKQVFLNLLQDARSRVTTAHENTLNRKIQIFLHTLLIEEKNYIQISIFDNGKEDLSRSLSHFESLEITRAIIQEHKGNIFRKDLEVGGEWVVQLPVSPPI
ncbi:response regulator [Leptospira idonii]|uniref:histidine kinase n=1 Tax=Leptospira idonii TaxID=1193500 RepID=A0A4R9LWE1_9LEPT|nr:response regulator [Leptospira idonii]TGN18594.1 hybrid sensor histidine kinase/response regulator [Leptospira idonii]